MTNGGRPNALVGYLGRQKDRAGRISSATRNTVPSIPVSVRHTGGGGGGGGGGGAIMSARFLGYSRTPLKPSYGIRALWTYAHHLSYTLS